MSYSLQRFWRDSWSFAVAMALSVGTASAQSGNTPAFSDAKPAGAAPTEPPLGPRLQTLSMPANGALLISDPGKTQNLVVEVTDPQGNPITGTLVPIDNYLAWRPTLPMLPGDYVIGMPQGGTIVRYAFTVSNARVPGRPALSARPEVRRTEQATDARCCVRLMTGAQGMCFMTQVASYASFAIQFTSTVSGNELEQFLFKLDAPGFVAAKTYEPLSFNHGPYLTQKPQPEFCWSLTAIDIASGATYNYDDLMPHCVSGADIGDLGFKPNLVGMRELDPSVCQVAPREYLAQWCEINAAPCGRDRSLPGCENYGAGCLHEPATMPPSAQAGASALAGAASGQAAALAGGAAPSLALAGQPASSPVNAAGSTALGALAGHGAELPPARHVRACSVLRVEGAGGRSAGFCAWALLGFGWRRLLRARRVANQGR